jgi:hypothetical protein
MHHRPAPQSCRLGAAGALVLLLVALCPGWSADGARIAISEAADALLINVDGMPFTTYHFRQGADAQWAGAYFFPLRAADGVAVTTNRALDGGDHPHHRSLWFAHGDVNGANTWSFGHQQQRHLRFSSIGADGFVEELDWQAQAPGTEAVLHEVRSCRIIAGEDGLRALEVTMRLSAGALPAVFHVQGLADGKGGVEAGMCAVRVAAAMVPGGRLENAQGGLGEQACRNQPAAWCDFTGAVNGKTYGITIFDHPANPGAPQAWHARGYGLLAQTGPTSFTIAPGASAVFRYRVSIHLGELSAAGANAAASAFAAAP